MSDVTNWANASPTWDITIYNELFENVSQKIPIIKLHELIEKSDQFATPFPISSTRCKTLKNYTTEEILENNINSAYPVVHEHVLQLYCNFILHKRKFGTSIEKELYKNMTIEMLVDRLLTKRAVVFVGPLDLYILLDRSDGCGNWESIGTPDEVAPLLLKDCLSYDEMKLSALLAVSSHSYFINVGNRKNKGEREENENKIERHGVIVGLVGPRFEKPNLMDYADIVVTKQQNTEENGYGKSETPTTKGLFLNFFGAPRQTYKQLTGMTGQFKNKNNFTKIANKTYFNNVIYGRRLKLTFDTFLIESNERARVLGKMAYVQVAGYGLGARRISNHQWKIFMDTFAQRIQFLGNILNNISDVCFSYIDHDSCGKYKHGDVVDITNHPTKGIKIHIINRDPHSKLDDSDKDKLVVVSYVADGNSLPGNEFWGDSLGTTSNPAAASSSQIAELHNAHINPCLCGANLRVATFSGLVTLTQYWRQIMDSNR